MSLTCPSSALGRRVSTAGTMMVSTRKTVAPGLPIPTGDHVVGGLAYNAVAGAAYAWFWDCGNIVRPDAIWRCDLVLSTHPTN